MKDPVLHWSRTLHTYIIHIFEDLQVAAKLLEALVYFEFQILKRKVNKMDAFQEKKVKGCATCSLKLSALMQFCPTVAHSHLVLHHTAMKQPTHSMSADLLLKPHC